MLVLLAFPAIAWPNQPIRWIVPSASGGSAADSLARQLAPVISRQLGQPLTVDNRPGAAGSVGSSLAARAAADGNTLLTGDGSTMVLNGALYKKQGYKAADFAPVGLIASSPLLLVVHKDSGFSSGAQWLAEVTLHPGKYSYASAGVGSPQHLAMELIMQRCRCNLVHVPYRAESFAISDLLVHALPMAIVDLAAALPELRKGRLQALALLGKQRQALLPGVPTFEELGLKGSRSGGAKVSDVHGNFLVNERDATACQMLALIAQVQEMAWTKRGIRLETEVQIVGEEKVAYA